jgi:glycosyltransferase involved in cell wall biosynthesis
MKIAHVVDSMEVGGAETLVSQLCELQREQGHDPSVYAIGALGPIGERMQRDGFRVQARVGRHLSDATRSFYSLFQELRPDAVHLHNPTPTVYAAMAARTAGVPSIVSTRHSLVARPRRLVVELKYAVAACFCDWISVICDATADNIRSIHSVPARKIKRIYNGALPLTRSAEKERPAKKGFTLLYVGRLAPVKNHALMLNAFCQALTSMPELQLWMVGDGSERGLLESMAAQLGIAQNVTFWGQQMDVAPYYSAADSFIMSSTSEGLPISLLQSFSLALPAIVTEVGGMAEAVKLARAGITVPVADSGAMAAAILRMAGDERARAQFAANAEAAFHAHFTIQAMSDSYMELYLDTPRARDKRGRRG